MAQLRIANNVRIGHIYDCNFGLFKKTDGGGETSNKEEASEDDYNFRIPNEMIKKRPVIVIGKHRGQYIVVPISSKKETHRRPEKEPENKGFHIKLAENDFPVTEHYEVGRDRWAKSNLVTTIDGGRLRDLYDGATKSHIPAHAVSEETVKKVKEGVIISIGLGSILNQE